MRWEWLACRVEVGPWKQHGDTEIMATHYDNASVIMLNQVAPMEIVFVLFTAL